jgi:hypothetical protein
MSAAIQSPAVTPEILAIIDQGSPKSQVQKPAVTVDAVKVQAADAPKPIEAPQQPAKKSAGKERGPETAGLVSVNFRLPATIPPALLRASSDRKIKKIQPFTQQDIVAEALTDWLKKNGHQV